MSRRLGFAALVALGCLSGWSAARGQSQDEEGIGADAAGAAASAPGAAAGGPGLTAAPGAGQAGQHAPEDTEGKAVEPGPTERHPGRTAKPAPAPEQPTAVISEPPPGGGDQSSKGHRIDKTAEILVDLGSDVLPLPSAGVTLGYYLRPNLILEGAYDRGAFSLWFIKVYSETLELRAKYFFGNSFYGGVGLARRAIGGSFSPSPLVGSSVLGASAEVDEVTLDTTIGNQWQWQNFTFGVDWLGVQWPLERVGYHDDFPNELVSQWARDKKHELFDDVAGGHSYSLLRFYFGASF